MGRSLYSESMDLENIFFGGTLVLSKADFCIIVFGVDGVSNNLNARTFLYGGEQHGEDGTALLIGLNLVDASNDELSECSGELSSKSTRGRGINRTGESM